MANNDLISKTAAITAIEEYIEEYSELEPETGFHSLKWCAMEEAKETLLMLPAVDAVPVVHARWINHYDDIFPEDSSCECSKCHELTKYLPDMNYCPNCGAKMDGGEKDG